MLKKTNQLKLGIFQVLYLICLVVCFTLENIPGCNTLPYRFLEVSIATAGLSFIVARMICIIVED